MAYELIKCANCGTKTLFENSESRFCVLCGSTEVGNSNLGTAVFAGKNEKVLIYIFETTKNKQETLKKLILQQGDLYVSVQFGKRKKWRFEKL